MKKLLTVFMILLLVAGFSYGQGKGKMAASVNGVVTIPFGDFGDAYKTGFGGTGTFMYFFTDQVAATFTAGYLTAAIRPGMSRRNIGISFKNPANTVPLRA